MLSDGEYLFFDVDLFTTNSKLVQPWIRETASSEENEKAKHAFKAVLTISAFSNANEGFDNFKQKVENVSNNFLNNSKEILVNSFVANFFDALMVYGKSLAEIVGNGSLKSDITGNRITELIWNRTHRGVMGNLSIDSNGDSKTDFSLLDFNSEKNIFEVVKIYHGITNRFEAVGDIDWPHRVGPPPDVPECGFDGSLCDSSSDQVLIILLVLVLAMVVILLVASVFIFRYYKREADIASMTWKIDIDEIRFGNSQRRSSMSRMSLVQGGSINSGETLYGEHKQMYMTTGYYKGSRVALKKILADNITLNRELLLDLKRMKDFQHDHLVRFVGACLDHSNPVLITEYCPRGSLQDILEEEEMELDWNFKYSMTL